ncbi:MAG: 3-isopropylmalate dehydratase large subunit [Candidatus Omnitrophica bacterium]|nr:3-isopropylmalate dehydratase large subunit [Candidatus Omnitrophota bacterium]MDD5592832.1 3-isopropylmalate dehydratase large subunit [Candidatus Omnitrophota bacterium]
MPHTIAEKILMAHTGKKDIQPGEFVEARVDLALGNDITAPFAIEEFRKSGAKKVFDNKKIALVPDHFAPAKDLKSANQCRILADFAREQKIKNYFEIGCMGIEHALLPEMGLVSPGDLVIGADSHTCTYGALGAFATGVGSTDLARAFIDGKCWFRAPATIKFIYKGKPKPWVAGKDLILYTIGQIGVDGALEKVMEFSGPLMGKLSMDDRFTMSNMAIEAGGVTGLIEPDGITLRYIKEVSKFKSLKVPKLKFKNLKSDRDVQYEKIYEWDISKLEPQVACPHLPGNVKAVSGLGKIKLDQVVIGSCTNGRISDLRIAARLLKGKKVKAGLRLIIIPATQKIYLQAVKEGLAEIFVEAGGVFSTPTCGPCLGGHMGILTEGETCLATTNRNFIGRMGSPKSFVYLASPAVAAASAIKGRISHP